MIQRTQATTTLKDNRVPEVVPAIRRAVPWRVRAVTVLGDSRLHVTFVDDTEGEVDMRSFLSNPTVGTTLFESLRDPAIFAQATTVLGVVQWPNGADLAPDAMYDAIRALGVWVVREPYGATG